MGEKVYINIHTGTCGEYEDWWYENEEGILVNAVDLNEVEYVGDIIG
jgi:hypothetical protein